jgi:hypothetical protein
MEIDRDRRDFTHGTMAMGRSCFFIRPTKNRSDLTGFPPFATYFRKQKPVERKQKRG